MTDGASPGRVTADGGTEFVREYGADESPTAAVARSLAAATDTDETDLEPLYEVIDPEALNAVLEGDAPVTVAFRYAGYRVTVTARRVRVEGDRRPDAAPSKSSDE